MIVLDEHLQEVGVADAISRWYRGRICIVTALRPGTVVKDDGIPSLLQTVPEPTFVTLNWKHFWQRTAAHQGYCKVARISGEQVAYYQVRDSQTFTVSLP